MELQNIDSACHSSSSSTTLLLFCFVFVVVVVKAAFPFKSIGIVNYTQDSVNLCMC